MSSADVSTIGVVLPTMAAASQRRRARARSGVGVAYGVLSGFIFRGDESVLSALAGELLLS